MRPLVTNLLTGLLVGSTAMVGAVTAADEQDKSIHRLIEVKAIKDKDITITVDNAGTMATKVFNLDQLTNPDYIDAELADLDESSQDLIRQALEGLSHTVTADFDPLKIHGEGKHKVIVVNGGEGEFVSVNGHGDVDYDFNYVQEGAESKVEKHIIIGGTHKVLKGHTPAIVKMIERGEFTRDELDEIQTALDAKR